METAQSLVIVGVVLASIAAVFQIIAVATIGWTTLEVDREYEVGLFGYCVDDNLLGETCYEVKDVTEFPDSLIAVRALVIIGLVGSFAGAAFGALTFARQLTNIRPEIIACVILIVAGVLALIGCIVFRADTLKGTVNSFDITTFNLRYSFGLSVAGAVLALIAGPLILKGGLLML